MNCPTLTHTPWYISCCRNGVYCMCLAEGHCRSGCGGSAQLLHFTHWHCCGRWKRKERGGNYRREMATERAVDCEVIHETQTLIPLDPSDPPTYTIRKCTDWKVWLEPRPLQTSQWKMALIKPQADMVPNYQDAITPQAEDMELML